MVKCQKRWFKTQHEQEVLQIDQAPVNVDQLITNIQADSNFVVEANPNDTLMAELGWMTQVENADKPGFFRRLLYKVRPPRELNTAKVPRISADVSLPQMALMVHKTQLEKCRPMLIVQR